ncbi:MAG: plasmid partitioning protein RepB C-terminal domain-containing protein [Spongiibacteraceae bacterium]
MDTLIAQHVEMIPIDRITVINPRVRNRKQHQEIVENIRAIGLKKPITVSRRDMRNGLPQYDLVCGQGRLEAFRALNQSEIPAIVVEASQEDCLLKSLVENVARRLHSPIEQLQEVSRLKERGYSGSDIAEKLGVSPSWVTMITNLLDNGEQRLLRGVESGLIPLSLATDIARSSDAETQELLTEAYTKGQFRGKKLAAVRRLLDQRKKQPRGRANSASPRAPRKKTSVEDLRRFYQTEAEKHRLWIKKADFFNND